MSKLAEARLNHIKKWAEWNAEWAANLQKGQDALAVREKEDQANLDLLTEQLRDYSIIAAQELAISKQDNF